MEMLPIVSLILWSTGLCTLALLGLAVKDVLLERRAEAGAEDTVVLASPQAAAPQAMPAAASASVQPLLKAA